MSEGDNHTFNVKKGMGLVSNIFNEDAIKKLKGNTCLLNFGFQNKIQFTDACSLFAIYQL